MVTIILTGTTASTVRVNCSAKVGNEGVCKFLAVGQTTPGGELNVSRGGSISFHCHILYSNDNSPDGKPNNDAKIYFSKLHFTFYHYA